MNRPPDPPLAAVRRIAIAALVLLALARLPWLVAATAGRAHAAAPGVERVITMDADRRIEQASGLSAAVLAAVRSSVPPEGRLVLYSPYGGKEFELDAADPRGEPARQVRTMFERAKNLLYPTPRDVHFARDADELLAKVRGRAGRAVVIDGTQSAGELAVGGRYSLAHTERFPTGGLLRVWKLEEER